MSKKKVEPPVAVFNLGDRVLIRHTGGAIGRVIEFRGALGPGGMAVYRVSVGPKPRIRFEVLASELEAAPKPGATATEAPVVGEEDAGLVAEEGAKTTCQGA